MYLATALIILAAAQTASAPAAQAPGISRTNLQEHDLSIAGFETIQTRVDFAPGAIVPRHIHLGEEIIYVLSGTLEYRLQGEPRVTLHSGDVLFIPKGKPHEAVNVGLEPASELATYILEKGKPIVVPVP